MLKSFLKTYDRKHTALFNVAHQFSSQILSRANRLSTNMFIVQQTAVRQKKYLCNRKADIWECSTEVLHLRSRSSKKWFRNWQSRTLTGCLEDTLFGRWPHHLLQSESVRRSVGEHEITCHINPALKLSHDPWHCKKEPYFPRNFRKLLHSRSVARCSDRREHHDLTHPKATKDSNDQRWNMPRTKTGHTMKKEVNRRSSMVWPFRKTKF